MQVCNKIIIDCIIIENKTKNTSAKARTQNRSWNYNKTNTNTRAKPINLKMKLNQKHYNHYKQQQKDSTNFNKNINICRICIQQNHQNQKTLKENAKKKKHAMTNVSLLDGKKQGESFLFSLIFMKFTNQMSFCQVFTCTWISLCCWFLSTELTDWLFRKNTTEQVKLRNMLKDSTGAVWQCWDLSSHLKTEKTTITWCLINS